MRSVRSTLIEKFVFMTRVKNSLADERRSSQDIFKQTKEKEQSYELPKFLKLKSMINCEIFEETKCYYLYPNSNSGMLKNIEIILQKHHIDDLEACPENEAKIKILYLHGGAYLHHPLFLHWQFCDRLVEAVDSELVVPLYPKIPNHDYHDAYRVIQKIYEKMTENFQGKIIVMGDSAGGGLALGFSQMIKKKKLYPVSDIILLSPWLDVTMSNPENLIYEEKDPMLAILGLRERGLLWAGKTNPLDPRISPINGILRGIGKVTLFIGTHELFLPDARKLCEIASQKRVKINYYEYPKMNHVFPLYPIPEAKDAFDKIVKIIKGV